MPRPKHAGADELLARARAALEKQRRPLVAQLRRLGGRVPDIDDAHAHWLAQHPKFLEQIEDETSDATSVD